jgi:hypothetical protein
MLGLTLDSRVLLAMASRVAAPPTLSLMEAFRRFLRTCMNLMILTNHLNLIKLLASIRPPLFHILDSFTAFAAGGSCIPQYM